jgi:hypothetical protein
MSGVLKHPLRGKILFETIYEPGIVGNLMFACWPLDEQDPKVFFEPELVDVSGVTVLPPITQMDSFQTGALQTASGVEEYGTTEDLWNEVNQIFKDYLVVKEHLYPILTWFVLYYGVWDWYQDEEEKFEATIYQIIRGIAGKGKNRILEVFRSCCLRTLFYRMMPRETSIFRMGHAIKPLMLFDELFLNPKSPDYTNFNVLWNSGIAAGGTVPRQEPLPGSKSFRTVNFNVFFPKIAIFQEKLPPGAGLSRSIIYTAEVEEGRVWEKFCEKDRTETPFWNPGAPFARRCHVFRNKLLLWRFHVWNQIHYTEKWTMLKQGTPRLYQVLSPMFSVIGSVSKNAEEEIKKIHTYAKYLEVQRLGEETQDLEMCILQALYDHLSVTISLGPPLVGVITSVVNEMMYKRGIDFKFSPQKISGILKEKFYLETVRESKGVKILVDLVKLKGIAESFGAWTTLNGTLEDKEKKEVSEEVPKLTKEEEEGLELANKLKEQPHQEPMFGDES